MGSLCGNETFGAPSRQWQGERPEFSCLQTLVLTSAPRLAVWTVALIYFPWLVRRRTVRIETKNWLYWAKQVLGSMMLVLSVVTVLTVLNHLNGTRGDSTSLAQLFVSCAGTATMLLVLALVFLERQKGVTTSIVLFLFWLTTVIADLVPFYNFILRQDSGGHFVRAAVFYMTFTLQLFQLGLHSVSQTSCSEYPQNDSPETAASFPAWLTYCWISRLMSRGYKDELREEDVFRLNPRDRMLENGKEFLKNRIFRRTTTSLSAESHVPAKRRNVTASEKTPLLSEDRSDEQSQGLGSKGRGGQRVPPARPGTQGQHGGTVGGDLALGWTLVKMFCWSGVVSNVWKLPHDLLLLANPLLLGELIRLCDDVTVPEWRGYVTGAALCTSLLLQALLFHLTFHLTMTLGLRVKAALTAAIFKKILTVSSKGRHESPEGEIINLVSVDTQHITVFLSFLPYAWSGPVQLALSVYFLYRTIGLAAFAGAGLLLLLLPANAWLMSRLGALQTNLMEHKDTRLKMVTEILSAIKTVKVYAWERILGSRVSIARERELHELHKVALLDASQTVLWALVPFCMSLLTFTTHVFTDAAAGVTSEEVFVTLSYLNVMRGVVSVAPMVLTDLVKAAVSLKRLERFLNHEDLDPDSVTRDPTQETAVTIHNLTCCWEKEADPCLKGISLQIEEGSLVAVVGAMGSGKSSLLAAILGELHVQNGHVTVHCAASYVPQQAWLRQSTVRDNILALDHPFNPTRYNATLSACALTSDLAALPAGDLTEIGEKGMTLSGGQRQRISLARAVYESRDLYLMDDPISAVDNRVGRQIFHNLIGQEGLLRDATRIVATSTYQWLPEADVIVVMSEGAVVETGDYQQLVSHGGLLARLLTLDTARGMKRTVTAESGLSGYQSDDDQSDHRELEGAEKVVHPSFQPPSSTGHAYQEAFQVLPVSNADTKRPDLPRLETRICLSLTSVQAGEENAVLSDDHSSTYRPRSPTPDCCSADNPVDLENQELRASAECRDDSDDNVNSAVDEDTVGTTLTLDFGEGGGSMTTVVEHSEDDPLTDNAPLTDSAPVTDSARRKSRHHGLDDTLTTQCGACASGNMLTSVSCEALTRGRLRHALVDEEHVHVGKVKWQIYVAIVRALGGFCFAVMTACYIMYHVTSVSANYWLSHWTDDLYYNKTSLPPDTEDSPNNALYLAVYGALGAGQCVFVVVFALLLAARRVRASCCLHAALLDGILLSPLSFFHRNPTARMLNRMSRDLEVFDTEIWWTMEVVLDSLCHVLSTCVVVSLSSPFYLLALLPVSAAYYFIQRYYIGTSRQLRRLESQTRSPVFAHLADMLAGSAVLRAAGTQATEHAYETAAGLVDSNLRFAFASNTASRWLGVRVAAIGVVIVGVATSLGVALRYSRTGGLVGLTITYALDVTENLNWLVRMAGDLETNAVSVERILEYSRLTPEHEEGCPTLTPPASWPSEGRIQFSSLCARYSPESALVLRGIDCLIQPGEKVGVVGRTGAGKTSLWGVLLRLMTSTQGAVLIDDVDTRTVPCHELRKRIAVMPQEPLILDGSIRLNLDPESRASDGELWAVLRQTQLANHVRSLPGGLDYHCKSEGQGLSAGQRQLLCLARVLLRRCRVLVLDEATSSVDMETDDIICQTIQSACAECTVLIVSHRLSTVRHCDRVMVLHQGRLVEMDSPHRLLSDPFSHFSRLTASSDMTR